MFATTVLLSACVLTRGEGESDLDILYPLEGDERRRVLPPVMGVLNGPCRNTPGDECNYGLKCHYYTTDGTSTSGKCIEDDPEYAGGINEPCQLWPKDECKYDYLRGYWNNGRCTCKPSSGPYAPQTGGANEPCNPYPQGPCNHDNLKSSWESGQCMCRQRSRTGDANQKCNPAGQRPCNRDNLRAHYVRLLPSGTACTCQYFLGNSAAAVSDSDSTDDSNDDSGDDQSTGPSLGLRAPVMGVLDGPCRNTPGYECNFGLRCHYYTTDGTSTSGRCVLDYNPYHPHHHTGGWNEPCNQPPVAPCNSELLAGNWDTGSCMCRTNSGPQTGEAGGRCNRAPLAPCNHDNLQAHWVNLHVQATAFQPGEVCTCQYLLGSSAPQGNDADVAAKAGVARLGARAPSMGGEGEPCFNTPGHECNDGMYCKYTNHGSWTSGVCLRQYMPQFGKLGQPCNNGQCDSGLYCKYTNHGSFTTNVCEQQSVDRGHTGEQCNLLGSNLPECFDSNDYCKVVHLLPSGTTHVCAKRTAALGERCGNYARQVGSPTECDTGLVCTSHRLLPSGTSQTCDQPVQQGGANQPCRSNVFDPCDGSLVCNYFGTNGPTCIYWLGNDGAASAPAHSG